MEDCSLNSIPVSEWIAFDVDCGRLPSTTPTLVGGASPSVLVRPLGPGSLPGGTSRAMGLERKGFLRAPGFGTNKGDAECDAADDADGTSPLCVGSPSRCSRPS